LPAATAREGFVFTIKNTSSGDVTIDPDGSETINGNSTFTLMPTGTINVVCDGTNWVTFGDPLSEGPSSATVATDDKVIIQDTDDNDSIKTVTAQAIADLAGTGSVLQITQGTTVTPVTVNSTSYAEVQTFNFTPVSDSSTIVILYNGVVGNPATSTSSWDVRIQRDTTDVIEVSDCVFIGNHLVSEVKNLSITAIDSPATTSTIAYNVDAKRSAGSGSCDWNSGYTAVASKSILTFVEIEL
jgi:hypothetical protein